MGGCVDLVQFLLYVLSRVCPLPVHGVVVRGVRSLLETLRGLGSESGKSAVRQLAHCLRRYCRSM